ncbi:MAG: phosphate ABC transporter substrate-binding/OmpA family protein [Pseudomonadota bacterium]
MKLKPIKQFLSGTAIATVAMMSPAAASQVTLNSADNTVTITGELLGYDGETYTLSTAIGVVSLFSEGVTCTGAGCPVISKDSAFSFAGSRALSDALIPTLIDGFSTWTKASLSTSAINDSTEGFSVDSTDNGKAEISVIGSNTRSGFQSVLSGDATFALASRTAGAREQRQFLEAEKGDLRDAAQQHIVAVDGLLLVTHPNNPVRAITELNAAFAFSGQVNNWAQLGGRNAPITLYVREADSGTREVFENLLMRPNGLRISDNVTVLPTDAAIAEAVQNDPNGIGFTSFAQAGDAAALDIEGVCGLRTPATAFTIKTEEYPLTRLMYMYQANADLDYHAKQFLDFLQTDEAQQAVAQAGFIDQSISAETINSQGIRVASAIVNNRDPRQINSIQSMFRLLISAERLSTTYRFETGSARLDARAQADVERLAELLNGDQFENKEILFVGFTDSVGKADLNQILSVQRAELVRQSILAANPALQNRVKTSTVGFGEASPLGCNETDTGRRINRRVEIWVQDIVAENRS